MAIRSAAFYALVGCIIAPVSACAQMEAEKTAPKQPDLAKAVAIIIEKTNEFRKAEGRPKVEVNPKLTDTTRYFAGFMGKTGKYGHQADDQTPSERAAKHGYDYCIVLENIASQFNSEGFKTEELAAGFFEGWKKSPGHRRNMLDADVTETAVSIARNDETGTYYAVQMFGRPKSLAIEFSVRNQADAEIKYQLGEEKFTVKPREEITHQICRPEKMTVRLPAPKKDAKDETAIVTPANKDRYVISKDDSGYRLKKE